MDRAEVETLLSTVTGGATPKTGDTLVRADIGWLFQHPEKLSGYELSNFTEKRVLNGSTATLGDVIDVLCTLIQDLQT